MKKRTLSPPSGFPRNRIKKKMLSDDFYFFFLVAFICVSGQQLKIEQFKDWLDHGPEITFRLQTDISLQVWRCKSAYDTIKVNQIGINSIHSHMPFLIGCPNTKACNFPNVFYRLFTRRTYHQNIKWIPWVSFSDELVIFHLEWQQKSWCPFPC